VRRLAAALPALALVAACSSGTPAGSTAGPVTGSTSATPIPGASSTTASATPTPSGPPRLVVRTLPGRLPHVIAREAVIRRGHLLVVAGGLQPGNVTTAETFVYDTDTGRSRPGAALPVAVHDVAGAFAGGSLIVVGGGNATVQDVVQAAAPDLVGGWQVIGHLPQPRSDVMATRAGRQIVVLGGYDGRTPAVGTAVASIDGVHWAPYAELPVATRYSATAVFDKDVYLFGGEVSSTMQRAVQRVDAHGHAKVVARLPVPLGHSVAVRLGDRILLAGGRTTATSLTDRMWWFDPATDTLTPAGHLPTPLADAQVAVVGGTAYVVGGETPAYSDRVVTLTLR
jgi:N-acetylneuraminic acid mutarotase